MVGEEFGMPSSMASDLRLDLSLDDIEEIQGARRCRSESHPRGQAATTAGQTVREVSEIP